MKNKIAVIRELSRKLGNIKVVFDKEVVSEYSRDETKNVSARADVVVFAESAEDVSAVLKICTKHKCPVVTRGLGSGVSGGAVPVKGGVILSLAKMNRILDIDPLNMTATVETGVITLELQKAVLEHGLIYPPDPASADKCSIGGNIAESAGGPSAVKYGTTKDYILGMEFVTADGDIMNVGGKFVKNATGYNLAGIITGSEGTLCVVTKAILRLVPKPKFSTDMLLSFATIDDAVDTVFEITKARIIPATLEFMDESAIKLTANSVKLPIPDGRAYLLVRLDGSSTDDVDRSVEAVKSASGLHINNILIADNAVQQEIIWSARKGIRSALAEYSPVFLAEDCVVPRSNIPAFIKKVKADMSAMNLEVIFFGHAGDGNVHINILKKDLSDKKWLKAIPVIKENIYSSAIELGGTISGEHGIGSIRKDYMGMVFSNKELKLMKRIKKAFDPDGILNPGKIL